MYEEKGFNSYELPNKTETPTGNMQMYANLLSELEDASYALTRSR